MSKRIKTKSPQQRDYKKMLKDYFGFHLYGLNVKEECGQIQAEVIYEDFKHIDTVRKELAQMMPEVEFVTLRREYTMSAQGWALLRMTTDYDNTFAPVVYVQRGDTLVKTTIRDIACNELRQLELEEDDEKEIRYNVFELQEFNDDLLLTHSME